MATRPGDQRLYVLLGSSFIRPFTFDDPGKFVSSWLPAHPRATFVPISRMISTNRKTFIKSEIVYIWVEEGGDSLNIDLVRKGVFAGATMFDMVDNEKGLDRLLKSDPKLADTRAQIEKDRSAYPEDRIERLVPEDYYKTRLMRVEDAEKRARADKLGIWSDEMKEERESEGIY